MDNFVHVSMGRKSGRNYKIEKNYVLIKVSHQELTQIIVNLAIIKLTLVDKIIFLFIFLN
jgi:hypothetical protein